MMEMTRRTLSKEQQEVLSNPNVFTAFLYLLDSASTKEDLARRTGFKPLETSVYLDRMREVGLVGNEALVSVGGKNMQTVYQVMEPNVDFSSIVPSMSASVSLDLVYNKVQNDVTRMENDGELLQNAEIRYGQLRVRKDVFPKLKELIASIEAFIQEHEVPDGEETINLLLIGYKNAPDQNH